MERIRSNTYTISTTVRILLKLGLEHTQNKIWNARFDTTNAGEFCPAAVLDALALAAHGGAVFSFDKHTVTVGRGLADTFGAVEGADGESFAGAVGGVNACRILISGEKCICGWYCDVMIFCQQFSWNRVTFWDLLSRVYTTL